MKNHIPYNIYQKIKTGLTSWKERGVCLFLDIAGFSTLTEEYLEKGKEGAEVLSGLLNGVFSPIVTQVNESGGFVATFAGDALTLIFPESENRVAVNSSLEAAVFIDRIFQEISQKENRLGVYRLNYKIGLSYGDYEGGIIGKEDKVYYFRGEAISNASTAEHSCGQNDILADRYFYQQIEEKTAVCFKSVKSGLYKLTNLSGISISAKEEVKEEIVQIPESYQVQFTHPAVLQRDIIGEFRQVVVVFLAFEEREDETGFRDFVELVIGTIKRFGGYLNCLDFGDKGSNLLVYFGAPVSYEDNLQKAVNFVNQIRNKSGLGIKAGINSGAVLSWKLDNEWQSTYACLGNTVNLAARLMEAAEVNQVLSSRNIKINMPEEYLGSLKGKKLFKGFSKQMEYYEIKHFKGIWQDKTFKDEFIEREETEILLDYFQECMNADRGGLSYVYGTAGIGKSRLVYELLQQDNFRNYKLIKLQGDSINRTGFYPFLHFIEAFYEINAIQDGTQKGEQFKTNFSNWLQQYEGESSESKIIIEEIKRDLGLFISLFNWQTEAQEQVNPVAKLHKLTFFLRNLFLLLSQKEAIVLQIEDFQDFDRESCSVLEAICRNFKTSQLLMIITSRYTEEGERPAFQTEHWLTAKVIELGEFSEQQTISMLRIHFEGEPDTDLLGFISKKTLGNPFYIEQFCLYLKENKFVQKRSKWILDCPIAEIPEGIQTILISRLDKLTQQLREVVQLASVIGLDFNVNILSQLLNNFEEVPLKNYSADYLYEGQSKNIWGPLNEMTYIFKHALLREAAYEMQLRSKLRELHGMIYEILVEHHKDKEYEIAYHAEKAERYKEATDYYWAAGQKACDNFMNELGLFCFQKVRQYSKDIDQLINAYGLEANLLERMGKKELSLKALLRSLELAKQNNLEFYERKIMAALATVYYQKGEMHTAMEMAKSNLEFFMQNKDHKYNSALTQTYCTLGLLAWRNNDLVGAMEYHQMDLKLSQETGSLYGQSRALNNMGSIHIERGETEKALENYWLMESIGKQNSDKLELIKAYSNIAMVYLNKGDFEEAEKWVQLQESLCKETGDVVQMGRIYAHLGGISYYKNDIEKSIMYFREEEKLHLEYGNQTQRSVTLANLGSVYSMTNQNDKAIEMFEESKALRYQINYFEEISALYNNLAIIYKKTGRYDKALENYQLDMDVLFQKGIPELAYNTLFKMLRGYLGLGNNQKVIELSEEAIAYYEKDGKNVNVFSSILFTRAQALQRIGHIEPAEELLNRVVSILKEEEFSLICVEAELIILEIAYYKLNDIEQQSGIVNDLQSRMEREEKHEVRIQLKYYLWKITHDEELRISLLSELKGMLEANFDYELYMNLKEVTGRD